MKAKACPPTCLFDWDKFHDDLDIALAHIIDDASLDTPDFEYMPTKMSVMTLLKYVDEKGAL